MNEECFMLIHCRHRQCNGSQSLERMTRLKFKSSFSVTCNFAAFYLFGWFFFCPGSLFQDGNISEKKVYEKVKTVQDGIRRSICLANVFCGLVLLGVILSHVISRWCLHCSVSLQDTLGVIASHPDNLLSLSLCLWKGKMLVALEASLRVPGMHPKHFCKDDSLS